MTEQPQEAKQIHLKFAVLCHRDMTNKTAASLLDFQRSFPQVEIGIYSSSIIARLRNQAVEDALQTNAEYLIMSDDDMVFTPQDVASLVGALIDNPKAGCCGAIARTTDTTGAANVNWVDDKGFLLSYKAKQRKVRNLLKKHPKPIKVDVIGTGLMAIRCETLRSIPYPWFNNGYVKGDSAFNYLGEDVFFNNILKQHDWEVLAHFGVSVGHVGRIEVRL